MRKLSCTVTVTSLVRLHVVMESSSDDSGDDEKVEGEIESEDDDIAIVDEQHETSHTTSTLSSAANNSSGTLSRKKRWPRLFVWKFFSTLQDRKSVQCQLCTAGNRDGVLAYHGGTSLMRKHFKRHHYTAFYEAATTANDSSDTPVSSKPGLTTFVIVLCVLEPVQKPSQTAWLVLS